MIEFKIIASPDRTQQAAYAHAGREIRFGRSDGDMFIDDPLIASLQARLFYEGTGFFVENLGEGEIKLNGKPVARPTAIKEKDNLVMGRTTINITRLDTAAAPPLPARFENPAASARFTEGTREKAVLDALDYLAKAEAGLSAGAPKGAPPRPPVPPPPPRKP
jgi:pSer/pThr/pTyr-binding forkhead associated (FHA) protein